jgi:hypothetical protein
MEVGHSYKAGLGTKSRHRHENLGRSIPRSQGRLSFLIRSRPISALGVFRQVDGEQTYLRMTL